MKKPQIVSVTKVVKKILLIVSDEKKFSEHLSGLMDAMGVFASADNIELSGTAFSRLSMYVDGDKTFVRDSSQGFDVADFDLVVFRTIGDHVEEAMAVAAYCRKKGVKRIDSVVMPQVSRKLNCVFDRWAAGLNVPVTAYGPVGELAKMSDMVGLPAVLKATNGRKGHDNYLVKTKDEIIKIVTENSEMNFVLQNFIPNDGDFRVLVLNYDKVVVSHRKGNGSTHLNNVSAGGSEEVVTDYTGMEEALDLAREAAKLDGIEIAGVDIIVDKNTGTPYVLEVNRAPQLTLDEEIKGYYDALKEQGES